MNDVHLIEAISEARITIDFPAVVQLIEATQFCPACQKKGTWRTGVHFDHEMRCADCQLVWEPQQQYLLVEKQETEKDESSPLQKGIL